MSACRAIIRTLSVAVLAMAAVIGGTATTGGGAAAEAVGPPAPLTVTPSTGLVDNQAVTATAPAGVEDYVLCPTAHSDAPEWCGYAGSHTPGQTTDVLHVPARVSYFDTSGTSSVVDCRTTSCTLLATAYGTGSSDSTVTLAAATLGFDASAALRTPPTISVTPNTGLTDGQQITATVTMTDASGSSDNAVAILCAQPASDPFDYSMLSDQCGFAGIVPLNGPAGGPYTGMLDVGAYVETSAGPVDCRASGATCTMVTVDPVGQVANAPLHFTPGGPVNPALLMRPIEFSPSTPPPSTTTYDVVGFTPNDPFTVKWCNDSGQCLPAVVATGSLDTNGMATFTVTDAGIHIPTGDDTCATDGCQLTATDAHGQSASGGPVTITGSGGHIPGEPFHSARLPVHVSPHKNLQDGSQVTVTASGFKPGTQVAVLECSNDAITKGISACDIDTSTLLGGQTLTADADGNVTTTYTIKQHISTASDGDLDCADGNVDPDAYDKGVAEDPSRTEIRSAGYFTCMVVVADPSDTSQSGGDPIAFAGATFKPLPWEQTPTTTTSPPAPPTTAPPTGPAPATPVSAQPTYTG